MYTRHTLLHKFFPDLATVNNVTEMGSVSQLDTVDQLLGEAFDERSDPVRRCTQMFVNDEVWRVYEARWFKEGKMLGYCGLLQRRI